MKTIKVLGSGCKNCQNLESAVKQALNELEMTAEVVKVTEMKDILSYGVMKTPALVIDERVVVSGRVPSAVEVKDLLK